jgi:hypothetical protein
MLCPPTYIPCMQESILLEEIDPPCDTLLCRATAISISFSIPLLSFLLNIHCLLCSSRLCPYHAAPIHSLSLPCSPVIMRSPSSLPAMHVTMPWCAVGPSNTCLHFPVFGIHRLTGGEKRRARWDGVGCVRWDRLREDGERQQRIGEEKGNTEGERRISGGRRWDMKKEWWCVSGVIGGEGKEDKANTMSDTGKECHAEISK